MQATLIGDPHHLLSLDVDPNTTEIEQEDHFGAKHRYVKTSWVNTTVPGGIPVTTEAFFAHSSLSTEEASQLTHDVFARDGYLPGAANAPSGHR